VAKNSTSNVTRLPRHRAPFYFAPKYLRTAEEWRSNIAALVEAMLRDSNLAWSFRADPFGPWTLTVRFLRTDLTIDARNGTFMIEEFSDDQDLHIDNVWVGPLNSPTKFYKELLVSDPPASLRNEVQSVAVVVSSLIEQLASRYRTALDRGFATIEARPNSILNSFEKLDPDQAKRLQMRSRDRHFDVPGGQESIELDDAVGPNGEQLFSLCVVASDLPEKLIAPPSRQKDSGRVGRPETVNHDVLEQVMLEILRAKGTPARTKPTWTGEIFAEAVIKRMAEKGLGVSRPTILKKKPLIIQNLKKSLARNDFSKSINSKISKH
jgi:hypothetical protein